ncbi:YdcH family protein [Martelella sp. FLE1502]
MSNTPHELADEFPEFADRIHELKVEDAHFAKLFDDYHEVNRAIHRAEENIEPTDDAHMEEMRKRRMVLKDEIYGMLKQ